MPLDKQGPSFSRRARLSNGTSGRGRKDAENISPSSEGRAGLLDRIQAVSPRFVAETNCSVPLRLAVSPRLRDNCVGRELRELRVRGLFGEKYGKSRDIHRLEMSGRFLLSKV